MSTTLDPPPAAPPATFAPSPTPADLRRSEFFVAAVKQHLADATWQVLQLVAERDHLREERDTLARALEEIRAAPRLTLAKQPGGGGSD